MLVKMLVTQLAGYTQNWLSGNRYKIIQVRIYQSVTNNFLEVSLNTKFWKCIRARAPWRGISKRTKCH